MPNTLARTAQIHIRVSPALKRAVKVHCAQAGITEQAWIERLIEADLGKQAPDLHRRLRRASARPPRGSR
jgi:hypothetical protein